MPVKKKEDLLKKGLIADESDKFIEQCFTGIDEAQRTQITNVFFAGAVTVFKLLYSESPDLTEDEYEILLMQIEQEFRSKAKESQKQFASNNVAHH